MLGVLQVFFQRAGGSGGAGCVERLVAAPCVAVHSGTKGGGRSLHPVLLSILGPKGEVGLFILCCCPFWDQRGR